MRQLSRIFRRVPAPTRCAVAKGQSAASAILAGFLCVAATSASATLVYVDDFQAEVAANQNVPFFADVSRSSPFGPIDECTGASGILNIRTKTICDPNPSPPGANAALDFTNGGGSFVTFAFPTPSGIPVGTTVAFEILPYFGGDSNALLKSYSTDGTNFIPLGNTSDAIGFHSFSIPAGPASTLFFRLQENGNGFHMDNVTATIPEPMTVGLLGLGLVALALRGSARR